MRQANVKNAKNGLNIDESILYYNKKLSLNDYINNKNIVNNNMNQFIKFYKSKNKFNKIELYETPNFEKLKYIIDNKSKFIKSGYQRVVEDAINYKKNVKSNLLKVVYKENKDIRLKTTPSVNSNTICKNLRNFIFDNVIDLDIVNSQISVFINLIDIYDLGDYPILTKVYKNKATFLKANNLSKDELIKIINNGKVNNTMDCMILCNEMDSLYNEFIKLEIFKPLYKKCMNHLNYSNDQSKNIKSSFISWVYQSIECKILLLCYDYLIDNNHTISSLEYDGIKIKNNFDKVDELNEYVKLHTGLDIEFTIKEMTVDKELKLLYDNFVDSNTLIDNGTIQVADNDREASNIIYEKIKNILIFSRDNYYYKQNNVWISNFKNIRCLLINYVMDFNLFKSNDKGDLVDYSQNRRNAVNIADSTLDKCVCNVNDNFVNNIFSSSLGYILFNNGYYDFKNSKFINLNDKDFNNKIIFTEKIAFDFDVKLIDNDYINDISNRLFTLPFNKQIGDYYLLNLARGLAGDCMKRCIFGIGDSNTGKSMITSILKECIEGYFGDYNAVNLTYKKYSSDEASNLRWLMLLKNKRIICSNELKTGTDIDGNMLKKVSNGGLDAITARGHCSNEVSFKLPFLMIVFANDINRITPKDDAVMRRVKAIHYTKVFVDTEPENEFELKMDKGLDEEIKTDKFKINFLQLLFNSYKNYLENGENEPDEIKQMKDEIIGVEDSAINILLEDYEITNDENDYIESNILKEWLKSKNVSKTITKFGLELNKYCKIKKLENVISKVKKIKGKPVRCWIGIRELKETDSYSDSD